jgi:Holliday junction resolvase
MEKKKKPQRERERERERTINVLKQKGGNVVRILASLKTQKCYLNMFFF